MLRVPKTYVTTLSQLDAYLRENDLYTFDI